MSENKTTRRPASIYHDGNQIKKAAENSDQSPEFVIEKIRRIPPEKFSLTDSILIAVGLMVLLDFGLANLFMYFSGGTLNNAITSLSNISVLGYNVAFVGIFTLIILRDSVEIKFRDVRGADQLLEVIIKRFNLKAPQSKNGQTIFKPTLCNVFMWPPQKMRVIKNGSFVTISGSYIFLRKVKKALRSYQN